MTRTVDISKPIGRNNQVRFMLCRNVASKNYLTYYLVFMYVFNRTDWHERKFIVKIKTVPPVTDLRISSREQNKIVVDSNSSRTKTNPRKAAPTFRIRIPLKWRGRLFTLCLLPKIFSNKKYERTMHIRTKDSLRAEYLASKKQTQHNKTYHSLLKKS